MRARSKKGGRRNGLGSQKKTSAYRLLASSTLHEQTIRDAIGCYTRHMPPADAAAATGLSLVTIYRLYGHIRKRLSALGLYKGFARRRDELASERDWENFLNLLQRRIGSGKGINAKNRDEHFAEQAYFLDPIYTPDQLYRLILKSARLNGPLNREITPKRDQ